MAYLRVKPLCLTETMILRMFVITNRMTSRFVIPLIETALFLLVSYASDKRES